SDLIRRAIALAPEFSTYHTSLGNACLAMSDVRNAFNAFRRAADLNPTAEAYAQAARVLGTSSSRESIDLMRKAIEIGPATVDMYITLGAWMWLIYRIDEAAVVFRKGLEMWPNDMRLFSNLLHTVLHVLPYDPQEVFD